MQWTGRQAVVTLPQHIDGSNAGQIRERLLWIINRGAAVLIADLAGTLSCDYGGAEALARAHHRAAANGTELRLVVTADAVRRVLRVSGLDRPVAVYPDLDGAIAASAGRREARGEHRTGAADQPARTGELLDSVVHNIFTAGLLLQAAATAHMATVTPSTTPDGARRRSPVVLSGFPHLVDGQAIWLAAGFH